MSYALRMIPNDQLQFDTERSSNLKAVPALQGFPGVLIAVRHIIDSFL